MPGTAFTVLTINDLKSMVECKWDALWQLLDVCSRVAEVFLSLEAPVQYLDQTKSLFQLQSTLVDTKVEIAVKNAISQVVDQIMALRHEISGLRHELHSEINALRHEMIDRFSKVESRLSAVETTLGKRDQVRGEIRSRFFDYAFKTGYMVGVVLLSAGVSSIVVLIKPFIH